MSETGEIQTPHMADTEPVEDEDNIYGSDSEEVVLKTPEDPNTRKDIRELVTSWKDKFHRISEGVRMDEVMRESRVRENAQVSANKQMKSIMEAYDPARHTPSRKHLRATLLAHDGNM